MNEIPELNGDLAFLKKFDSRNNVWKEFDVYDRKGKEKVRSNFLLHPKRLSSDSECSTNVNTPRKLYSGTIINGPNTDDQVPFSSTNKSKLSPPGRCYNGAGVTDDGDVLNTSTPKNLVVKKGAKIRPYSFRVENFDKKAKSLIERCLKLLSKIRTMIEQGIPSPDGEEDLHRRTKRLQEFLSRFSRIYLYPLTCHMEELGVSEKLGVNLINQKLLSALQTILQALQAYYTHLPSSVDKCGSDKLKALLDQILYLCRIYELRKDSDSENWEFINAMRKHVELLLETITNFDIQCVKAKQNEVKKKTADCKPKIGNKPKSKLSMYTVNSAFKKQLEYRNRVELLTKKKYSVKSKYKVAGFKHRPPVVKPIPSNESENKMKLIRKCSSGNSRTTSIKSPIKEDEIKTLVEMDSDVEAPPNTTENMIHQNSNASSRQQLVQDNDQKLESGNDKINVEKALEVLRKFFESSEENKSTDFLEKIANEIDKKNEKTEKAKKEPVITVTGAKNAKLICIRDDNSLEEEPSRIDKEIMTDVEVQIASSETQTDIKASKSKTKVSRLPKHDRKLILLPKDYAISIIQYKLRYSHFHKHNPMYRKSAHIQPWVLMGKISDEILDFILKSITKELEVNEILENLYNAEFQY